MTFFHSGRDLWPSKHNLSSWAAGFFCFLFHGVLWPWEEPRTHRQWPSSQRPEVISDFMGAWMIVASHCSLRASTWEGIHVTADLDVTRTRPFIPVDCRAVTFTSLRNGFFVNHLFGISDSDRASNCQSRVISINEASLCHKCFRTFR